MRKDLRMNAHRRRGESDDGESSAGRSDTRWHDKDRRLRSQMVGVGGKCGPARGATASRPQCNRGGRRQFHQDRYSAGDAAANGASARTLGIRTVRTGAADDLVLHNSRRRRARGLVGAQIARRDDYLVDRVLAGAARRHGADDDRDRIRICRGQAGARTARREPDDVAFHQPDDDSPLRIAERRI